MKVSVPSLPRDDDSSLARAAQLCLAEWTALEALGLDTECIHGIHAAGCQDPYDFIHMNCGVPMAWSDGELRWYEAHAEWADPTFDPRYDLVTVKVS